MSFAFTPQGFGQRVVEASNDTLQRSVYSAL